MEACDDVGEGRIVRSPQGFFESEEADEALVVAALDAAKEESPPLVIASLELCAPSMPYLPTPPVLVGGSLEGG